MRGIVYYIFKLLASGLSSFGFFWLTSHPKSKLKKSFPNIEFGDFRVFPNLKLRQRDRVYHLHHWAMFSLLYLILFLVRRRLLRFNLVHGAILGVIIQGLTYSDRFKFRY